MLKNYLFMLTYKKINIYFVKILFKFYFAQVNQLKKFINNLLYTYINLF